MNPSELDRSEPGELDRWEFDVATALEPAGENTFAAAVRPGWDIGGRANGGYLLALAGRGLREIAAQPDPVTVTAHYLSPAPAGPAVVTGQRVRAGARFATVTGSLHQDGRERIQVLATFGDLAGGAVGPQLLDGGPPDLPPPEACVRNLPSPEVFPVPLMQRLLVLLDPGDAGYLTDQRSGRAEVKGYLGFVDGRPFDTLALLLASDAFPPAVFNSPLPRAWVPTLELTVHVRAEPAPGLLRCRFGTRFIQGGLLEEDGEVWDERGVLVAQCRQLALVPRAGSAG